MPIPLGNSLRPLLRGRNWTTLVYNVNNPWFNPHRTYMDTQDKAVFVTGCDSGFGHSAALMLHDRGYRVFAGCLSPKGEGASRLQRDASDRLTVVDLDITDDNKIGAALATIEKQLGQGQKLWALINNAGVCVLGQFEWHTNQQMANTMNVNVLGTMKTTKAFLPLLRTSKGRVIFVGSLATQMPSEGTTVYTASKYALVGLSKTLRFEMLHFGVRVILIEPAGHVEYTGILGNQQEYQEQQWASMSQEAKQTYELGFAALKNAMAFEKPKIPPPNSLKDVTDLIQKAVESPRPKDVYRNTTLPVHLMLTFTRFLPEYWADRLMHRYVMSLWKTDN